jgi:hypothetical protein
MIRGIALDGGDTLYAGRRPGQALRQVAHTAAHIYHVANAAHCAFFHNKRGNVDQLVLFLRREAARVTRQLRVGNVTLWPFCLSEDIHYLSFNLPRELLHSSEGYSLFIWEVLQLHIPYNRDQDFLGLSVRSLKNKYR